MALYEDSAVISGLLLRVGKENDFKLLDNR